MTYIDEIRNHPPANEQEAGDQASLLWFIDQLGDAVLSRDNPIAHITSSGFIMTPALDRVLMVHHNIRNVWSWTGGHADGDDRLLAVAIREAQEETGARQIVPLSDRIASLDILCAYRHHRRGRYVGSHLHLSVAYILLCGDEEPLRVKPDENSAIRWFDPQEIRTPLFHEGDVYLYTKLIAWAKANAPKNA